jgi:hypothetical protein
MLLYTLGKSPRVIEQKAADAVILNACFLENLFPFGLVDFSDRSSALKTWYTTIPRAG